MKKKTAKRRATRGVQTLSAKPLTAKQARSVKGGSKFFKNCVTGKHIAKATLVL